MRQTINGAEFRRLMISAAASIEINKQTLNELNVFPVPDGDTGTNMSMTINAAANELRKVEDPSLEKAASVVSSATPGAPAVTPVLSCPCCSRASPRSSRALTSVTAFCGLPLCRKALTPPTRPS